jgi:lipopolysaccharide export LptBFGC system permease protein LptF
MTAQAYLVISILALLLIAVALILIGRRGKRSRMSPLVGVALALIVAANLFENELIAYGFIGAGVIVALIDLWRRRSKGSGEG